MTSPPSVVAPRARRGGLAVLVALAAGVALGWLLRSPQLARVPGWPATAERLAEETAAIAPSPAAPPPPFELVADRPVRGVVFMVGDGMGLAQIAAARAALLGPDGRFALERLPVTGLVATHPAKGLVTKSDAAATALASGHKTLNGRVGAGEDGRPLRSILEIARDAGFATALVSTTDIVDATPAAFGAHSADRAAREDIAAQLVAARIDVLLGAGAPYFLPAPAGRRKDGRDLTAEARAAGWTVARDTNELAAASGERLLGLFDFDPAGVAEDHPSVAEMTAKTLATIGKRPRFFAMIEQEGIDTRSHRNTFDSMAKALAAFDQAVAAAVEWARADGAVLVVVTADHETGGLSLFDDGPGRMRLAWTSVHHSGAPVGLFAYGPQAPRFTGLHDNTEIPRLIAEALAIPAP
jgi:alkaline phosphatase